MRFLIDNALSPLLATLLARAGHEALHVREIELQRSDDVTIFDRAAAEDRIVVSADTDFGTLLATRSAQKPSVILSFIAGGNGEGNRKFRNLVVRFGSCAHRPRTGRTVRQTGSGSRCTNRGCVQMPAGEQ